MDNLKDNDLSMGESMGIGVLGQPNVIIKRRFRWALEIQTPNGKIGKHFVKTSGRPQVDLDETELHFKNAVTWIPGKGKWQPLSVTYIDAIHSELEELYNWLATVYNFTDDINLWQAEKHNWNATAILKMYDGCGNEVEEWQLKSCFPQSIKWGDLDYADSSECTIELTLRFSEVTYTPLCGMRKPEPKCDGCVPINTPPVNTGPILL